MTHHAISWQTNRNLKHQKCGFDFDVSWQSKARQVWNYRACLLQGFWWICFALLTQWDSMDVRSLIIEVSADRISDISIYDLYASHKLLCKLDGGTSFGTESLGTNWGSYGSRVFQGGPCQGLPNCYHGASTRRQLVSRRPRHQCPSRPRSAHRRRNNSMCKYL